MTKITRRSSSSCRRRKRRSKVRKPRYLSLSHALANKPRQPPLPIPMAQTVGVTAVEFCALEDNEYQQEQLDLFPLHPEPLFHDGDREDDDRGEYLPSSSPSSSVNYDRVGLARMALRGRERWVFCSREGDAAEEEEEASSYAGIGGGGLVDLWGADWRRAHHGHRRPSVLCLKLDYDEVLSAWSDKGPLYIEGEGEGPQVVPHLNLHDGFHRPSVSVDMVGNREQYSTSSSVGGVWAVPESGGDHGKGKSRDRGRHGPEEENCYNREDRVMRYREKRRSRLFSKRIRYEVRKLNAEKRPRIKGRFVKRVEL